MWEWNAAIEWINANWLWVVLVFCAGYVPGWHRGKSWGYELGVKDGEEAEEAADQRGGA